MWFLRRVSTSRDEHEDCEQGENQADKTNPELAESVRPATGLPQTLSAPPSRTAAVGEAMGDTCMHTTRTYDTHAQHTHMYTQHTYIAQAHKTHTHIYNT